MKFDDIDVGGSDSGLIVDFPRGVASHVTADDGDGTLVGEGGFEVGDHRLPDDLDGLCGQVVFVHKRFTGQDDRTGAIGGW